MPKELCHQTVSASNERSKIFKFFIFLKSLRSAFVIKSLKIYEILSLDSYGAQDYSRYFSFFLDLDTIDDFILDSGT